jgi:hypothetical protein
VTVDTLPLPTHGDATVVVPAPDAGPGNWSGAASAVLVDGVFWLTYRVRRPLSEGRGVAVVVSRSLDGMVMVRLGGIQTLSGPIVGAAVFTWLQDTIMRQTPFWRGLLGLVILLLVLAFPGGIVGALTNRFVRKGKLA